MDGILFDLDGTLIDTRALYSTAYLEAFQRELETPPSIEEMYARHPASERLFLLDWFGEELGHRIHQTMLQRYATHAPSMLQGYYEHIEALLDQLLTRGAQTALITGKSRRAFEITKELIDLSQFEIVIVEEDVTAPKPDPEGICMALERLRLAPDRCAYVGDTLMDLEAARRAGMRPIAALWGKSPDAQARFVAKLKPDVWPLYSPTDLMSYLKQ